MSGLNTRNGSCLMGPSNGGGSGPIPPQGEEWEAITQPGASNQQWQSIAYGNGLYVACASGGTTETAIMTSPDGKNWTSRTLPVITALTPRSVVYGNGMFVISCSAGFTNRMIYSADGITWSEASVPVLQSWFCVTFGRGLFVALSTNGAAGGRCVTSPDGVNWTVRSTPTPAGDIAWEAITYGNGLFVAVASSGTGQRVMTSPDGITWTMRTSAADQGWREVCYGNGLFVAVGTPDASNNAIMTSPNGIDWTLREAPVAGGGGTWFGVVYGNGTFIAVGSGSTNRVMTSVNGIDWEGVTAGTDQSLLAITFGNGLFVAVGNVGINRILISGRPYSNSELYADEQINNFWNGGMTFARFLKLLIPTSAKIANIGGRVKEFFTDAGNTNTGETDLYSYSTEAGMLSANGQGIEASFDGIYAANGNLKTIRVYFGGTEIFDFAVNSNGISWAVKTRIIRVSSSVVRCCVDVVTSDSNDAIYTEVTGLTLTGANILKITGQSDTASNDIVAKLGAVKWSPESI